jgi:hypothetical protein
VRDLKQLVTRIVQHHVGPGIITVGDVPEAGELAERIVIDEEQGNLQRAAARLGVTDRALQLRRASRRSNGNGGTTLH